MKTSTTSLIYHLESKHNIKLLDNTIPVIEGEDESNDEFDLNLILILPDNKTLKELVLTMYNELKPKVEKKLKESSSKKSITTDGWSSAAIDPYLVVTSHFVDINFRYFSITMDFAYMPHPHDKYSLSANLN